MSPGNIKKAVFIDRDGTINRDRKYTYQYHRFEFLPGALDGLKEISKDYLKIVITNQSGIARGYYTEEDFQSLNDWFRNVMEQLEIVIDDIVYCPHHPDDNCDCRKPKTGMLTRMKDKFNIDLKQSYLVGDMVSDMLAGRNAGCRTILVRENDFIRNDGAEKYADYIVESLLEAADIINKSP
ncbi:MAG: D-glycero-beta-D-manno-heptose 1,7-bisphosphate 7-phosphatase [candidate division Zixibacteria bacterium]|nr:D-glycero-beta-D-manno-heptose 1,7-bisphosphate 7-phosphatase [candidate division Zixibacteria bacterium]